MRFVIQTAYDQKALTVMAQTLRKTLRHRGSRRSTVFGVVVVALGGLILLAKWWSGEGFGLRDGVTLIAMLVVLAALFTRDAINGWAAGRKLLPGMETVEATFTAEKYVNAAAVAETHWNYGQIKAVYETEEYFVFFLSDRHGQIYRKSGFLDGTPENFRTFISEITGKPVEYIK